MLAPPQARPKLISPARRTLTAARVRGLAAALVAGAALAGPLAGSAAAVGGVGGEGGRPPPPPAPVPDLSAAGASLRSATCPGYRQVRDPKDDAARVRAARRGTFYILNRPIGLSAPVNWAQDPYNSKAWRQTLHQWVWMEPLFAPFEDGGEPAALRRAVSLALDWSRHNPQTTWSDKVTADRAGLLGYLIRAAACKRVLSSADATALLESAYRHGQFLADPANYGKGNHALFVDAGMLLLTSYLPWLPSAGKWRELALRRFKTSLAAQVSTTGVNLEHSPAYQFKVFDLVDRVYRLPGAGDPGVVGIRNRMRNVAPWFVMPDGLLTRLGDTSGQKAPEWAQAQARRQRGTSPTRDAGFAIAREPDSYLSVTSQSWNFPHSQSDQLTFELWDRGRRIIADTGRRGGTDDPAAVDFTESSMAHSVLIVDGQDFRPREVPESDEDAGEDKGDDEKNGDNDEDADASAALVAPPDDEDNGDKDEKDKDGDGGNGGGQSKGVFGSGITGMGRGDGWFAIEGRNPLVAAQGVQHTRLFLNKPGVALVVVDNVQSAAPHSYTRLFQFDPAFRTSGGGRGLPLRAGETTVWLYDAVTPGEGGRSVVRGQRQPLLGWMNSTEKLSPFVPRTAVAFPSQAASTTHVATLGLKGLVQGTLVGSPPGVTKVRVAVPGEAPTVLTVTRSGGRLSVR